MELTGLATLAGMAGTASAGGESGTKRSGDDDGLQRPVRADEPAPEAQELLDALAEQDVPHLYELSTEEARELYNEFFIEEAEPEPVGDVEDLTVPGPNGEVPIRVYTPEESKFDDPLPVSIYMHGGGWVVGNLETHDSVARDLCQASEGVVVSIDYRRGPEHPFPAAVEDCWAVTQWVAENASDVGADAGRMAVTGESAGGDMTAVMTFLAKDDENVEFVHQLPIYPVTDLSGSWLDELPDTFSVLDPETEQKLDRRYLVPKDLTWFAERYLPYGYAAQNLYASPLLAHEEMLCDLPPATIVTTGFGPLGDQGYLYAKHLREADVPVDIIHYEEMIHDFLNMEYLNDPYPDVPQAEDAKVRVGEVLKEAFSE